MQIFASFSFYFYFYLSEPFQMGLGKIWETINQLSLASRICLMAIVLIRLFTIPWKIITAHHSRIKYHFWAVDYQEYLIFKPSEADIANDNMG